MPPKPRSSSIRIGGSQVRLRLVGEGRPLLMLMGIGGNIDMWQPLAEHLTGHQLILFDHPGTGGSGAAWLPPTMPWNAWIARQIARAAGYRNIDVLGYSWGGMVAQQLAFQHPWAVRRLVLASTTIGWGSVPPTVDVIRKLLTPKRYYTRSYLKAVAPSIYGGKFRTDPVLADREADRRLPRPPSGIGYLAQMTAAVTWSSLPIMPFIQAPTLVIAGDDDPIVPLINTRMIGLGVRHADVRIVKAAGHLFLLDSPEEAAAVIKPFLEGE